MKKTIKITNKSLEKLDVLVEGNEQSKITVVMVHGFGTDKHDTAGLFDDINLSLIKRFRIVRLDFSGCGQSEGKFEEKDCEKWASDLDCVLNFVKTNYSGNIYIIAMSMGTFITALLSPKNILKTIFISMPGGSPNFIIERMQASFLKRKGANFNEKGISILPRSWGICQKIGSSFWKILRNLKPKKLVSELAKKTKLIIFVPLKDEVFGNENIDNYKKIKELKIIQIRGNHSFKNLEERKKLIIDISNYLSS